MPTILVRSSLALCCFLIGCKNTTDVECFETPDHPACVTSCMTDPTQEFCSPDMGDVDGGGLDMGRSDGGDAGPCGACPSGRPLCDTAGGECVECLSESDCGGDTPLCDDAGTCVQCATADDCDASAPVCSSGSCTDCGSDGDCTAYTDTPFCGDSGACVACTADAECTDVGAAKCDTTSGTCVACDNSAQCAGTGQNVCVDDVCVACTEATAASHCGDNSCNPATNACTGTERRSVLDCGRCVGDDECMDTDARCVPMNFMGTARPDGYCLKLASTGACARPYLTPVMGESLSGFGDDETTYCGIDQNSTTCDAVRALRESRECTGGNVSLCADAGARCEMVGLAANQCTYSCGAPSQCPTGFSCDGDYCGS